MGLKGDFESHEHYGIIRANKNKVDQQKVLRYFCFKSWLIIFLMLIVEVDVAAAKSSRDLKSAQVLFELINERLNLIKEVAAYKYTRDLPSYIPGREQQLLADIRQIAVGNKLDLHTVQLFLDVQLRMAVELQNQWRKQWVRNHFPNDYEIKDLYQDIRPELSRLTNQIVQQIAKTLPILQDPEVTQELKSIADETLMVEYLTQDQKDLIFSTLLRIKRV